MSIPAWLSPGARRVALGCWLTVLPLAAMAQSPPVVSRAVAFGESKPLRTLEVTFDAAPAAPPPLNPAPSLVFTGLTSDDDLAAVGTRFLPPDTVGDVGPNHYVQMVNVLFRVFDKSGNPLTAPATLGSLFSGAGISTACTNNNDGVGVVLYDPLADRWLLSEVCTAADPFSHQLIAISKTANPTGAYFLYDFVMPNAKRNLDPKLGVWTDAYYMADRQLNQTTGTLVGTGAFAFDRAKMLTGDPTASYVYFDVENGNAFVTGMLPSDLDGSTPPPAGTPNYFAYFTANELGDPLHPFDALRIFELHADFTTPAASTFTERADSPLPVAAFDSRSTPTLDDIEQPSPATGSSFLDAVTDRLMFRLAYRNFGGHESLVVNHTVNVGVAPPTTPAEMHAGIRYYELRRNLPSGAFTVAEQATFAPDSLERWMGSAAMDGSGNLAVGYSVSSLSTFPSIRFAGRLASDPPGGLAQGEAAMFAGSGVQTSTFSRWGSDSALSVDPADDCTFWYTNEYYTAASQAASSFGWLTGIGAFLFPSCVPATKGTVGGTVVDAGTSTPIAGATVATTSGFVRITDAAGAYSMKVPSGTYDMTASAPGYSSAFVSGVTVSTNGTTAQSFALSGVPVLSSGAPAVTGEGCAAGNGAVDPGETVTVSLPVTNVGHGASASLVGTLLVGGGVTEPGPPQTYGVISPGGTVARGFGFRAAGSCGGRLTARLQLHAGASDLGTLIYTFTLGQLLPTVTYSTGNLSTAIPDFSTVDVPLAVPDGGAVADVNARIRLSHTYDGDLYISLLDPAGTTIDLSSGNGTSGDNYGSGANNCSGNPTVFDDSAAFSVTVAAPPFALTLRPEQPLSTFVGAPSNGTWKLRIRDAVPEDSGTLFCFKLEVARAACCVDGIGIVFRDGYESGNTAAWSGFTP